MTAHYIYYDGKYRVYVHDGRGHRIEVGPRIGWDTPRAAAQYADLLDQRSPSPLRSPGDGLPAVEPVAPGSPPSRTGEPVSERSKGRPRRRRAP